MFLHIIHVLLGETLQLWKVGIAVSKVSIAVSDLECFVPATTNPCWLIIIRQRGRGGGERGERRGKRVKERERKREREREKEREREERERRERERERESTSLANGLSISS
jgi:hypothetical protein